MERIYRIALNTSLAIALPLSAASGFPQCQNKTGFAKQLCEAKALGAPSDPKTKPAPANPGLAASALSTGIQDAVSYDTLDASLSPKTLKPLSDLSRNSDGAFVLERGMYEASVETYSLDSGAPGGFAGFVPATVRGSGADAIRSLLKYAELHPEVAQADIQQTLSALATGANYADWSAQARKAASAILPAAVLQPYQGAAQSRHGNQKVLSELGQKFDKAAAMNPKLKNADDLKNSFAGGAQESAQPAPPPAAPQTTAQAQPVPRGTWLEMPGGFYLRYMPEGANRMRLQLFVPDTALVAAKGTGLTFDPTEYVALLSQAPFSRIGITLRGVAGLRP
jgi:hypothetical protein